MGKRWGVEGPCGEDRLVGKVGIVFPPVTKSAELSAASAAPALAGIALTSVNSSQTLPDSSATILTYLTDTERLHVDSIIEASGLNAQTVLRLLLELELEGRVTQHPGKLFSLA